MKDEWIQGLISEQSSLSRFREQGAADRLERRQIFSAQVDVLWDLVTREIEGACSQYNERTPDPDERLNFKRRGQDEFAVSRMRPHVSVGACRNDDEQLVECRYVAHRCIDASDSYGAFRFVVVGDRLAIEGPGGEALDHASMARELVSRLLRE